MISIAFQTDKPINAYGPLARQAEAYGFDGVSVYNDLFYQPAWLPLLEMARHTNRVRLGPAAVNPFTCHPINIAGNMALLDEASNGRSYLGIARGAWLDYLGLHPPQPITAVREALDCVRHLLRQSKDPLPGKYFSLAGGESLRWPIPRPDVPIMLGAWGVKTIAACLDVVDEIKLGGSANPDAVGWLQRVIGENGRSPAEVGVVLGAVTVVDEDRQAARELARREAALYLPVIAALDPTVSIEPDRLAAIRTAVQAHDFDRAAGCISDEILQRFTFSGTPADIITQTEAILTAGASRIEFGTPHGLSIQSGLTLLGEKVLPNINQIRTQSL